MAAKQQPIKTEPLFDISQKISVRLYNGENHDEILDMSDDIIMESNKLFLLKSNAFDKQHIRKGYYVSHPSSLFNAAIVHPKTVENYLEEKRKLDEALTQNKRKK
jgi:hypothetical protein